MRWELKTTKGATLRCVRAVDTATHPDFHRRGIFRRLTEQAIEEALSDGVDLVFNTPNERSGAGYLSMGWVEVGKIDAMVRPTRRLFSRVEPAGSPAGPDQFLNEPILCLVSRSRIGRHLAFGHRELPPTSAAGSLPTRLPNTFESTGKARWRS